MQNISIRNGSLIIRAFPAGLPSQLSESRLPSPFHWVRQKRVTGE